MQAVDAAGLSFRNISREAERFWRVLRRTTSDHRARPLAKKAKKKPRRRRMSEPKAIDFEEITGG